MRCRNALIAVALGFAVAGCDAGVGDVCDQAAQHVASCTGSGAVSPSATCGAAAAELAQQTLTASCDQIAAGGKADALSSPGGMAVCIALGIPLFVTGQPEGNVCCFSYNCNRGLTCRKFKCQQPSALGGPCDRNGHCVRGLACIFGKCDQPRLAGETCGDPGDCAGALTCGLDERCAERAPAGEPCTKDWQCDDTCINGTCGSRGAEQGACDADADCQVGLTCEAGSCVRPPASGAACDRSVTFACDMNETCWDGVCVLRHGAGEPCDKMFDCTFGLFCREGLCAAL